MFELFLSIYLKWYIKIDFEPTGYKCYFNPVELSQWHKKYEIYFEELENEYTEKYFDRTFVPAYIVFSYYCGNFHKKINSLLRGNYKDMISQEYILERIDILKRELQKFSIAENVVVVRRISKDFLNCYFLKNRKLKNGLILEDKAFLSTSINLASRKDSESEDKPFQNKVLLLIKVPRGSKAIYLEPISNRKEYELLLEPGLKLRVEKHFTLLGNTIIVCAYESN